MTGISDVHRTLAVHYESFVTEYQRHWPVIRIWNHTDVDNEAHSSVFLIHHTQNIVE